MVSLMQIPPARPVRVMATASPHTASPQPRGRGGRGRSRERISQRSVGRSPREITGR